MKYIDYDEYKELRNIDKIEKLNTFWDTKKSFLQGTISVDPNSKARIFIEKIKNLEGDFLENPFTKRLIDSVYCDISNNSIIYEDFKTGDLVVFKFNIQPPNRQVKDKNSPIIADANYIWALRDLDDILKELNLNDIELNLAEFMEKNILIRELYFPMKYLIYFKRKNL